jgi:hypothetical protein
LDAALGAINASDVRVHIDALADAPLEGREAGTRGGRAAVAYLVKQFESQQLSPAGDSGGYVQAFRGSCSNILGVLAGSDPELRHEYVLVGAHFDHVGYGSALNSRGPIGRVHHGADDNASGVAGVLELQDACQTLPHSPRRSILFALWDGEEKGMWGSRHWLAHPTVPLDKIVLVFNLDMIGRLQHDTVHVYGSRTSWGLRRLLSERNRATNLSLDFSWDMKPNSDHYAFFDKEIPILMLHTGLHADFHRPSDSADKIDHEGAERVTRLAFAALFDVANADKVAGFRDRSRQENAAGRARLERPLPDRALRLGVAWRKGVLETGGVLLTHITPNSPAARAGLRTGDRLLRFADYEVRDERQLQRRVLAASSPAAVLVERGDRDRVEVTVRLAGSPLRLEISWRDDDAEPGTVVVSQVVPGSAPRAAGLLPGDRIYQVQGRDFADGGQLSQWLQTQGGRVELLFERRGRLGSVVLQ